MKHLSHAVYLRFQSQIYFCLLWQQGFILFDNLFKAWELMVDWRTKENAEFGEFFQNASTDFSISYWLAWGEDGCCVIDFDTVSQQLESLWWLHLHQSLACHYGLKHACQIGTKLLLNMNKHGNECYTHINIHTCIFYSGLVQSIKSVCSENGTAFVAVACSERLKWGGWKKAVSIQ